MQIIICPNEEKVNLLKMSNDITNVKYMTKREYLDKYYFSYDDKSILFLMDKYNLNIDVCKSYLKNLYVIDISENYKSEKLEFLKEIKKDLIENNLLYFSNTFKNYLEEKDIIVKNYYDLDKYEEDAFGYKYEVKNKKIDACVYEFKTIEEEVNFVCLKIIELLNKGIDINKIYLTNVTKEYLFILKKMFSYYKIPISIDFKDSIYSSLIVKKYLETGEVDLSDTSTTNKKLINVINSLSDLSEDKNYKTILIDKLKSTYLNSIKYDHSVTIKDLFDSSFNSDEYVFILGFNQDILPRVHKDIDLISDREKTELDMYDTNYLNKREKELTRDVLNNISNKFISYKLSTPFEEFFPSSLIEEDNLEVIRDFIDSFNYSNIYNEIRLGEYLDDYYLYNEKDQNLDLLNSNYDIPYNTYSNNFTGIDNNLYLRSIIEPMKLAYTSLNTYNECKFKYYLKYILKLDIYEDTFEAFLGTIYHHILTLYKNNNFDLDIEFNKYLENRELNLKEKLLLVRIKRELKELIDILKKQDEYTSYKDELYEREVKVELKSKRRVEFIGYIDKIMYRKNIEDTYSSIIDYKTGKIDTNIEPMKYGLHMQLPVYLYLIHYSKLFTNPIFTGIYYQNILFPYPSWDKKLALKDDTKYYLQGYSTDNLEVLEKFDNTYRESKFIKSLKYTDKFSHHSKIIDDDTMYKLVKYTKNHIEDVVEDILNSDFKIDPKVYIKENISCKYCKFRDICYRKDSDIKYLPKVDDLSFLGGDI